MRTRLREMTPGDIPAVESRLEEQNNRDGTSYNVPRVFDGEGKRLANIPLALVAVSEDTGEVIQGVTFEKTLEMMIFGMNPRASVCSMEEQLAAFFILRERGYRDLHILVPPNRKLDVKHGLERILGMSATGMSHFYRLLDPAANAELQEFYKEREAS